MEMHVNVEVIKTARAKRAWSQEQLAGAAGIGVRTVQRVETTGTASIETVKCLAAALECGIDEFAHPPEQRRWQRPILLGAAASGLLASAILFFARANAGEVMLDMVISNSEQNPKTIKMIAQEDKEAEVLLDDHIRIVLTPSLEENGRILLKLAVYVREGEAYKLQASPKVLTGNGVDARIDMRLLDRQTLSMTINPKRM